MDHSPNPNPAPAGGAVLPPAIAGASDNRPDAMRGFVYAASAYVLWGFMPIYMKAVADMSAVEVVAHRVLWSLPVAGIIILWLGRTADLKAALKSPRVLALAALTACLISVNWSVYVWAISVNRTVETALGYYINPLLNVVMGALFLGERFDRRQIVAVGLAVVGVAILTVAQGGLPWISLVLALSFGCYGFLRKTLPIGPTQGFMLEVILLTPVALALIAWFAATGQGHFGFSGQGVTSDTWLLMFAGPVTAFPLILYAFGAKLLRYSTIGLMQYIAPTLIFLIAVFLFREPFDGVELVAFIFIWSALAVYSSSLVRRRPAAPPAEAAKAGR